MNVIVCCDVIAELEADTLAVAGDPADTVIEDGVTEMPDGSDAGLKVTVPVKPPDAVRLICTGWLAPCLESVTPLGEIDRAKLGLGCAGVTPAPLLDWLDPPPQPVSTAAKIPTIKGDKVRVLLRNDRKTLALITVGDSNPRGVEIGRNSEQDGRPSIR